MIHETKKASVAIAEDHPLLLKSLQHTILQMGDVCLQYVAKDGHELITLLREAGEVPDLCILDIGMANMNGYQTIDYLRNKWPSIKVIVLTVYTQKVYVNRMMHAGANAYLSKSSEEEEITKAIRAVLRTGKYYSGEFTADNLLDTQRKYARPPKLTPREEQLLGFIDTNLTYPQIADRMHISHRSTEGIRDGLFEKLKVNSRQELVTFAMKFGYLLVEPILNPFKANK